MLEKLDSKLGGKENRNKVIKVAATIAVAGIATTAAFLVYKRLVVLYPLEPVVEEVIPAVAEAIIQ